ncbi:lysophospholipid acyltransferase 7-like protein [Anopheles sinensis]|uniref:Lysophospholipid acyltransferase 7-like protein n=1 Tax=Anopheles sinensis TaxID=74873 RepID=A0A084VLK4_ANOSI|nr:lysophospholipid acyltransferase 7-like protein [Anopheles sinensis]
MLVYSNICVRLCVCVCSGKSSSRAWGEAVLAGRKTRPSTDPIEADVELLAGVYPVSNDTFGIRGVVGGPSARHVTYWELLPAPSCGPVTPMRQLTGAHLLQCM